LLRADFAESTSASQPQQQAAPGITLADIPQPMEVVQAREEQRSLPRENSIPYIAELSALELAIVKHAALLALTRSALRDQFDLDELIELVETKKSGFWNKLFKAGDKKNVKKKGAFFFNPDVVHCLTCVCKVYLGFRLNSWSKEKVLTRYWVLPGRR
jgi:hypothetical protein